MKIISFDFDKTLVNTPEPEEGKPYWEKSTGLKWPTKGWWASPESLNTDVFEMPIVKWVHDHYVYHTSNPDNYVFIATGRIDKLKKLVRKILNDNGINCDLFCNDGGDTFSFKRNLFERVISENPNAEEFIMYDDREEHLILFKEWSKLQRIPVKIIDVLNKKIL